MSIALSVLGSLVLKIAGDPVRLRPAQRRVLSILALSAPEPIATDVLIERMWPEDPPSSARTALHVHISQIRKVAPDVIATAASGYRLGPDTVLDLAGFRLAIEAATQMSAAGDWDAVLDRCREALDLWRGDPVAGISDEHGASATITALQERHLQVQRLETEALIALDRSAEALPLLHTLVAEHPLHGGIRYQQMLALYRAGRQVEALRAFQDLRRTLGEELGIEPDPAVVRLEERILLHDPELGRTAGMEPSHNLPSITTSFVTGDESHDGLVAQLESSRLVTITGGPGFGKTRLAIEIGHANLNRYPGGVWSVDLAEAHTAEEVGAAIAAATAIHRDAATTSSLARILAPRPALLILDNCENALDICAAFASAVLGIGGELRILATSFRPLGVSGEQVWQLDPLPVPSPTGELALAEVSASPSVRLFLDRAQAIDRTFQLNADSMPQIVELSRRLAGIPLAIELAARWVPALGIDEITSMLDPLDDESTNAASATAASSLRAAIEWSLTLLPEDDRRLACEAAVFSGSFALDDVAAIASGDRPRVQLAAAVARIVDSSLLRVERRSDGSVRYRMLVPLREFLQQSETVRWQELESRFVAYFLGRAIVRQPDRFSSVTDLRGFDDDIDNIRAALDIGFRRGWVDEVGAALVPLSNYFHQRYQAWESRSWLERVLESDLEPAVEADVLRAYGSTSEILGLLHQAASSFERAISIFEKLQDEEGKARCLLSLAGVQSHRGEWEDGLEMAREALRLVAESGNESAIATAHYYIGENQADRGEIDLALPHLKVAADGFVRSGAPGRASYALSYVVRSAVLYGDEDLAQAVLSQVDGLAAASDSDYRTGKASSARALYHATWGDNRRAAVVLREAQTRIESAHPDEIFDFLLPAAAALVREGRWETAMTLVYGARRLVEDSEAAMPVPWRRILDEWTRQASFELDGSTDRAVRRANIATVEGLSALASEQLGELATAR